MEAPKTRQGFCQIFGAARGVFHNRFLKLFFERCSRVFGETSYVINCLRGELGNVQLFLSKSLLEGPQPAEADIFIERFRGRHDLTEESFVHRD